MAVTDELIYKIGVSWDKIGFSNLNQSIDKSVKLFTIASAAATAASAAIFAMGKQYAESTDDLIKQSERISTTTQKLQKLTFAAEDNGSSMDAVSSSLGNLAKAQQELLRGKGDFEAWGRLGVNPTDYQDTSDLLLDISDRVKDLSNGEAIDLMSRVGISPELLQTLRQGKQGLSDLGAELSYLGGIDTEQMKQASQEFMSGWQRTSTAISGVSKKISADLLQNTINPLLKEFNNWFMKNSKTIQSVLTQISGYIVKASQFIFGLLNRLAQPFIKLNDLLGGLENTLMIVGGAVAILQRKMILGFAPAILAIGALYLAFDDFVSFLNGEDSVFGDFFGLFGVEAQDVLTTLKNIVEVIKTIISLVSRATKDVSNMGDNYDRFAKETKEQGLSGAIKNDFNRFISDYSGILGVGNTTNNTTNNYNEIGNEHSIVPPTQMTNNITLNVNGGNTAEVESTIKRVLNEELNNVAMVGGN